MTAACAPPAFRITSTSRLTSVLEIIYIPAVPPRAATTSAWCFQQNLVTSIPKKSHVLCSFYLIHSKKCRDKERPSSKWRETLIFNSNVTLKTQHLSSKVDPLYRIKESKHHVVSIANSPPKVTIFALHFKFRWQIFLVFWFWGQNWTEIYTDEDKNCFFLELK